MVTIAELADARPSPSTPIEDDERVSINEFQAVARAARDSDESIPRVLGSNMLNPACRGAAERVRGRGDHCNPLDASELTNDQRAELLAEFVDALPVDPKLVPLREGTKRPDMDSLNDATTFDPEEAVEAVRGGHTGFTLWFGRKDHNTEGLLAADHDDLEQFSMDTLPETLTAISGSGRGFHEFYINDGDVRNSFGDGGEIRAENWFVIVSGSVHPSGGVYHVCHNVEVSTLTNDDLRDDLQPNGGPESTTTRGGRDDAKPVPRLSLETYKNDDGDTLAELRENDDELDALCSERFPEFVDHEDESRIDAMLVSRLGYAGFDDQQQADILRDCRPREKLDRGDYVDRTVENITTIDDGGYLVELPRVDHERGPSITTREARTRVQERIREGIRSSTPTLVDAIPSLGKSYGLVKMAAELDEPVTVFTSRHDLYDQYEQWCDEHGLKSYTLPSFYESCPTANGEHGEKWRAQVLGLHEAGATASEIHERARQCFGEPLPCEQGSSCPYKAMWDFEPTEYDVLVGYYSQAYNPNVIENRTVAFDEFVGETFVAQLDEKRVKSAVTAFLSTRGDIPFDDATDLLEARGTAQAAETIDTLTENGEAKADSNVVFSGDTQSENAAHKLAPVLVTVLLDAQDLGNGYEHSRHGVRNRETGAISVLTPPDLDGANTVLALDGTPSPSLWRQSLDVDLRHEQVLDDDERRAYISNELGLKVVRTSDDVKPYSSGTWVNVEKDHALFEFLAERHEGVGLISSKSALEKYRREGQDGARHGIEDTLHYGATKGTNQFGDKTAGVVAGSPHYGDEFVKRWSALYGETAERTDNSGRDLEYGCGVGNDALRLMRESQVAQATLRFGRHGQGATVYVHTSALPDWLPVAAQGTVSEASAGLKAVLSVVKGFPEDGSFTASDVTESVDIGKRAVNKHLSTLEDMNLIESDRSGRATEWQRLK